MPIINTPNQHIFTGNPHQFNIYSAKQRGQVNNNGAYQLVFSAIPSANQRLHLIWHTDAAIFTFTPTPNDSAEQISSVGVVLATWVRDVLVPGLRANFELSQEFLIYTTTGGNVFFKPHDYDQELSFSLGSQNNAPVTQLNTSVVQRDQTSEDIAVAIRVFLGVYGQSHRYISNEYYTPVKGEVLFRPGDIVKDHLFYHLPPTLANLAEMVSIYPSAHEKWGFEVADYQKSTGDYFVIERISGATAIKGAISTEKFAGYFAQLDNKLLLLSNFSKKRVSARQKDFLFFFLNDEILSAGTWSAQKQYIVYFINGSTQTIVKPINGNNFNTIRNGEITRLTGGYADANLEGSLNAQQLNDVAFIELVVTTRLNNAANVSEVRRAYFLEDSHYTQYYLMYQNSFGVPEIIKLVAGKTKGIQVEKETFLRGYTSIGLISDRSTQQYNASARTTYQFSTGFLPKAEARAFGDLLLSEEIYLVNEDYTYIEAIDVDPGDFELVDDTNDQLAINFKAKTAFKERGISL